LRPVYHLLYHAFAWTYDWAAALVSLGKWNEWIQIVLPQVVGPRVLELGYGPGHLQEYLLNRGEKPYGIDESWQMARIAYRRVKGWYSRKPGHSNGYAHFSALVRGVAQNLPFPNDLFSSVVSTFPAPYIFHTQTLHEAFRVLAPGGRLIILFTAWFSQNVWYGKWILRIFPFAQIRQDHFSGILAFFQDTSFLVEIKDVPYKSSTALFILATKPGQPEPGIKADDVCHPFPSDAGNA